MLKTSRSITRQTIAVLLLAQIGFALALGSTAVWHEWHGRMHALDVQIAGHSDSLLGAIQDAEDPEDNIKLDPDELRLPPEDRYAVYSDSGRLVGRSSLGSLLPQDGPVGIQTITMDGVRYRVQRRRALRIIDRAENDGVGLRRPVLMVYAAPMTHVVHETFEGVGFSLTSIAVVAIITGLLATWVLRKTMRPIRDLALAAQQVSSSSLHFDPPASVMSVEELRPLALTLAKLIQELGEAFDKQQRFVSDAAHELKTAVAVVRSAVQVLMMKRRTTDEYVGGLEQILQDNSRVEDLVVSMLELAHIEQAAVADAPLLDFGEAVRLACSTMQVVADASGVLLQIDAPPHISVHLNVDRAETLVTNLLSNSIRHSAPGTKVSVVVNADAHFVTLRVADAGSGIRAEALPHVFDRFYRDDPSRSRTSGGTGLGLAISKSIVQAAGGTIHIRSKLGSGTTVTALFRKA